MADPLANKGFDTRAVHAGGGPDTATGARAVPIYQTTSYVFESADQAAKLFNLEEFGQIYSRITNPTVAALETRLASLEGGVGATAAASGHAAQFLALLPLLKNGDSFLASKALYGGSITQFGQSFARLGWSAIFVDPADPENFRRALTPTCRAIFIESLANPGGIVTDIAAIAKVAHDAGIPLVVDNTLATPYLCRPGDWGADLVVHSTTKFLGGHGNSIGGAVIDTGKFDWSRIAALGEPSSAYHDLNFAKTFGKLAFTVYGHAVGLRDFGAALAPFNAFLTLTGVETLALRMARHCENALAVAQHLEKQPKVAWVSYAGLASSPHRALAQKYLPKGASGVFTFGLKGGFDAGIKLVESCKLFSHLANIGDTRSLIIHPASTTHRQLSDADRAAAGAGSDVVRLSVGIETLADIIADLDQALARL